MLSQKKKMNKKDNNEETSDEENGLYLKVGSQEHILYLTL